MILYEHHEADTEAEKVAPHVRARFPPFIFIVILLQQWLVKTFLITLTAKGFNLHQCKSKILGGLQSKINTVSPVQIRDRSCGTLTFPCSIQITFPMWRYCCQLKLSGLIYQPEFFLSVTHDCFNFAHSGSFSYWSHFFVSSSNETNLFL